MATSAVSAGDVGDGVTDTRDGSAGTSCFFPRVWPMSHCGSVLT